MPTAEHICPVTRLTEGPFYHFYGYYDKCPWDATGRYVLVMRVAFMNRPPTPEDIAVLGMVDTCQGNRWRPVAETVAWYWQQGTMLQWLGSAPDRFVIFNRRGEAGFGCTILDVQTGEQRHLPRPIYAVDSRGTQAVSLNFSRVHRHRPGYGYVGVPDQWADDLAPAADGIYHMDLQTGQSRLIVSIAQAVATEHEASMDGCSHWFNHLQFNPSGTRFLFLHRWAKPGQPHRHTRMFTANPDGSDLLLLAREGMVSHFDWRDDDHILAWSRHNGENHYHLYADRSNHVEIVGGDVLDQDGHCSYSPDRHWILTDTYPDRVESKRTILLYHPATNTRINVGRFYSAPEITGEIRCDLHPRWNRDGTCVCFDSIHEGVRQMYLMDVSEIVNSRL